MFHSNSSLTITFDAGLEQFQVARDLNRSQIFTLSVQTQSGGHLKLGEYCSISESIAAVSQQRTGYLEWDQRSPVELPQRVHDIASWDFQQNLGTLPRAACS